MQFNPVSLKTRAAFLALTLSLTASAASTSDGTSGTVPDSFHECEIVVANWGAAAASPEASPVASPVSANPAATPVVETDLLTEDLEAATHAIFDCMSDNNVEVLTQLTGEQFRSSWLGIGSSISDADFAALLPLMPSLPYALLEINDASAEGNTATAIVEFTSGRQLMRSEWTYHLVDIDGERTWQVQQETYLPVEAPANAFQMNLTIADGSFTFAEATAPAGDIVINIENNGTTPHEAVIVRVPAGTTAADFAAAPSGIPSGGTFIGQVTVPAGSNGTIVLTEVRAGTYTVVDLLPDATGLPNVSNGMITEFTVD